METEPGSPFLKMGVILATFQSLGTFPVEKDELKIQASLPARGVAHRRKSVEKMLSGPEETEVHMARDGQQDIHSYQYRSMYPGWPWSYQASQALHKAEMPQADWADW